MDSSDVQVLNGLALNRFYDSVKRVFEFGEIPVYPRQETSNPDFISSVYQVSREMESLKLKLHGENYFSTGSDDIRKRINYGKLMHEVFEGINSRSDISRAIKMLVIDGKLPDEESADLEQRVNSLISSPQVADWFSPSNRVLNEAGILLKAGTTKRPDRVILKDGKTIVIDFKFGEENNNYMKQVKQYRTLLQEMGYSDIEAFIWYVDKNKVVPV
jgi:ATP-dependent helicase/nuclease subunit A